MTKDIFNQELHNTIIEELNEDSFSPTMDNLMVEFIKFNMKVYMDCNGGSTIYDSIDYIKSQEFHDLMDYYKEIAIGQFLKNK